MSGGGGDQEVKTEVPGFVKRPMKDYSAALQGFPGQYNPQFFPDQMYADQSPYTQQAIAGMGGADSTMAQDYYRSVLGGDYLGLNPAMRSAVMDPAMDAAASRYNAMGRYGSPASQEAMARAGMQSLMPYYNQERQRQGQAAALLPTAYQPQLQAGQLEEAYAQRPIDEAMARWEFEQERPYNLLNRWGSLFAPLSGAGGTETTSQGGGSTIASGLGGALAGGAALGPAIQNAAFGALGAGSGALSGPLMALSGPWGIAAGAGLGLLGGLL